MNFKPKYYTFDGRAQTLPFRLPEGQCGKWRVVQKVEPQGKQMTVVSLRNSIFMGLPSTHITLPQDTVIHHLMEGKRGLWMSTRFQEIEQHERQLRKMQGHVLVGGLGLGLAVAVLAKNPKVRGIHVVENCPDVIRLVKPHLPTDGVVVRMEDLYSHLKQSKKCGIKYDSGFFDIWCPTGSSVFADTVLPLRDLAEGVIPQDRLEMWNEREMIGQVAFNLDSKLRLMDMPPELEKAGGFQQFNPLVISEADWRKHARWDVGAYFWIWAHRHRNLVERADDKLVPVLLEKMAQRFLRDLRYPARLRRFWGWEPWQKNLTD